MSPTRTATAHTATRIALTTLAAGWEILRRGWVETRPEPADRCADPDTPPHEA